MLQLFMGVLLITLMLQGCSSHKRPLSAIPHLHTDMVKPFNQL